MSRRGLADTVSDLSTSADALAALGAALRVRLSGQPADPAVGAALEEVVAALGLDEQVRDAPPLELEEALASIRGLLLQASDLLTDPWRAPGWSYTDIDLLESQGRASAVFAHVFERDVVPRLAGLSDRLDAPGAAFLDVGVGVAGLAIEMCRVWPRLRVVGIDPWAPALELARRNIKAAGLEARIELRHQRVEELADRGMFDLAWLAAPFLPRDVLAAATEHVAAALHPGAWLVLGTTRGGEGLATALARLRTARSGGSALDGPDAVALVEAAGLGDAMTVEVDVGVPSLLVAARRVHY